MANSNITSSKKQVNSGDLNFNISYNKVVIQTLFLMEGIIQKNFSPKLFNGIYIFILKYIITIIIFHQLKIKTLRWSFLTVSSFYFEEGGSRHTQVRTSASNSSSTKTISSLSPPPINQGRARRTSGLTRNKTQALLTEIQPC